MNVKIAMVVAVLVGVGCGQAVKTGPLLSAAPDRNAGQVLVAANDPDKPAWVQLDEKPISLRTELTGGCIITTGSMAKRGVGGPCLESVTVETCRDKSRILMRSEDGKGHCVSLEYMQQALDYAATGPTVPQGGTVRIWQDHTGQFHIDGSVERLVVNGQQLGRDKK